MNTMKDALEKIAAAAETMPPVEGFAFATSLAKATLNADDDWSWAHQMFDMTIEAAERTFGLAKVHPHLAPTPPQEEAMRISFDIVKTMKDVVVGDASFPEELDIDPIGALKSVLYVHSQIQSMSLQEATAVVAVIGLLGAMMQNYQDHAPEADDPEPG